MTDSHVPTLQAQYEKFIEERGWEKFQTPKNIAEALSIEANELLECFLWHDNLDAEAIKDHPDTVADVEEELADVVIYSLGMASKLDIDLEDAVKQKLEANNERFSEERAEEITAELRQYQR